MKLDINKQRKKNYKLITLILFAITLGVSLYLGKNILLTKYTETTKSKVIVNENNIHIEYKYLKQRVEKILEFIKVDEALFENHITILHEKDYINKKFQEIKQANKKKEITKKRLVDLRTKINTINKSYENNLIKIINKLLNYLIYLIILIVIYKLSIYFKLMIKEISAEEEKEQEYEYQKQRYKNIFIWIIVLTTIVIFLVDNSTYILTTLSIFTVVLALGIRDLLSDIIVGVLISFRISLIRQGDSIQIHSSNETLRTYNIRKVGILKTLLYQQETSEMYTIKNSALIQKNIIILPIKAMHQINISYKLPIDFNLDELEGKIKEVMENNLKEEKYKTDVKKLRAEYPYTKSHFNAFPRVKPHIIFDYHNTSLAVVEMNINFNVYSENTTLIIRNDFFRIIKKEINRVLPELGKNDQTIVSMR